MTYYPVYIPTLNRYEHFKECVESLAACTHADKTELVIGLDYPPSEKYVEGWKKIKEYLPTIKGFAKVTIFEHDHNLGLGQNGNGAFLTKYVKTKYDAWISTEDDNVFSPCFLDYMNKCLEKYKDDDSIIAVSGYMNPVDYSNCNQNKANILRMQDYMAWGSGNWKHKRNALDLNMPSHYMKYVCSHRSQLRRMRLNLRELYQLIFWTKNNPALDIKCDFTIGCYSIINNKYFINPTFSLVRNMGYDGSGVNCGTIEDDYLARQPISNERIFDIKDNLTEYELQNCRDKWEKFKSADFSIHKRKLVRRYYYFYMFFGYTIGDFLLSINIKKCIKSMIPEKFYNFVKKIVKR